MKAYSLKEEQKGIDIASIEREYLSKSDWEVDENANSNRSFSNFLDFLLDKTLKYPNILSQYLPVKAVKMHFNGDIHIHKLPYSLWIPYCVGWSYANILRRGLRSQTVVSRPARHLDTAVSHLVNFFFQTAQEWTGAQAVSAFDLYTAPFVAKDTLSPIKIKQILQSMLFELNYPSRAGYQSPFTNITLILDTCRDLLTGDAIVGGRTVGTLGDYVGQAVDIVRALMELYLEGDTLSQPFTFPIPTLMVTQNFDWNGRRWGDLVYLIFKALAYRGTAYLLNGYSSNVEALYAMCCRLTINTERVNNHKRALLKVDIEETQELIRRSRGAWGSWALPDATGSIGVVTINLPRIAALSKGDWGRFEEYLQERLEVAREVLLTWRARYEHSLASGLMPLTKSYMGSLEGHYNTFGLVGLPEAAANFMNEPTLWYTLDWKRVLEAISIEKKMVALVDQYAREYEELDGYLYNVEEVPAESAAYRLASRDLEVLDWSNNGEHLAIPMVDGVPFYSNSIVPYYAKLSIMERAKLEGEVQQMFTGGVMMHLFLGQLPDIEALKKLVYRIATGTKVVYFSITPVQSVCKKCRTSLVGLYDKCPKCGGVVDVWSRIVGYYRPLSSWNLGKRAEFKIRVKY